MATAVAAPPITVEQYLGFEGYPGLRDELINGRIILSPQPKPHHEEVVENLRRLLADAFQQSPYIVRQNSNIRFDQVNSMPAPDIMVVDGDAWKTAIREGSYLSQPPLLVAEVLSPANRRRKVEEKLYVYLSNGVRHVWVADIKNSRVLIAGLEGERLLQEAVESIYVTDPVSFAISAADILRCL